jgi:hypothetical protein
MRWLSLFLTCQHPNSGTNLRECEDQSWFKAQAVPVFSFDWYRVRQAKFLFHMAFHNQKRKLACRNLYKVSSHTAGHKCTTGWRAMVYTMWEPWHLTTLWTFTACYGDSFAFLLFFLRLLISQFEGHDILCWIPASRVAHGCYIIIFGGAVNRNSIFLNHYFIPTTCFGPYGPSSGRIYTCQFLGAI